MDLVKLDPQYIDDTHPEVHRLLVEHWRSMTPAQKCDVVSRATRALHQAHLAGLRLRFPEASERELELRAAVLRLGRETVSRIVGEDELPPEA